MLTLILGGARSGKSKLAQRIAMPAGHIVYIATAACGRDPEMAARIERHRASRPASWLTIEEPLALASAVERASKDADTILVDCLTIWLSNLSWERRDEPEGNLEAAARREVQAIAASARHCHVILVSNELGSGTVPEAAVSQTFRDVHGILNQAATDAADEVILTVAGLPLYLKTATPGEAGR